MKSVKKSSSEGGRVDGRGRRREIEASAASQLLAMRVNEGQRFLTGGKGGAFPIHHITPKIGTHDAVLVEVRQRNVEACGLDLDPGSCGDGGEVKGHIETADIVLQRVQEDVADLHVRDVTEKFLVIQERRSGAPGVARVPAAREQAAVRGEVGMRQGTATLPQRTRHRRFGGSRERGRGGILPR